MAEPIKTKIVVELEIERPGDMRANMAILAVLQELNNGPRIAAPPAYQGAPGDIVILSAVRRDE